MKPILRSTANRLRRLEERRAEIYKWVLQRLTDAELVALAKPDDADNADWQAALARANNLFAARLRAGRGA